ncbi:hypothetical protein CVT25_013125 [Psilocybe cyanescens]|uniref:Uncharacterized protein n=1 Tax=Psilocybe cyanescens TaxID=93625 RepID=A0A409XHT7_PSICY|nr:hypothetical protein CVT25_013125 [Psilocybe cyanescens]
MPETNPVPRLISQCVTLSWSQSVAGKVVWDSLKATSHSIKLTIALSTLYLSTGADGVEHRESQASEPSFSSSMASGRRYIDLHNDPTAGQLVNWPCLMPLRN